MSWIKTIKYEEADPGLKRIYEKVKGPENKIDNVLSIHSLRPHSLTGHMALYKNVLHNSNNTLPKWYLESLGVYVSHLNACNYCVQHHFTGLKRLLADEERSNSFINAVLEDKLSSFYDAKFYMGAEYAAKLTLAMKDMKEEDILKLRIIGFNDGEILEINQVVSYFNYVNRTVLGLGVNLSGDILGLSPNDSDDPNNWNHS